MILKKGDNVSSLDIAAGKYLGKEKSNGKDFHKIFDSNSNLTAFIPVGDENKLRKLPCKSTVIKNLEMFDKYELIDSQQLEGSRYKYFKAKLERMSFKIILEVYHDLTFLTKENSITTSERKLCLRLKDRLINEISHIFENKKEEAEHMLSLKKK